MAIHIYESGHKQLPIGVKAIQGIGTSWWVDLLPCLEEQALFQQLNLRIPGAGSPVLAPGNWQSTDGLLMPIMRCPSSSIPSFVKVLVPAFDRPSFQICLPSYVGLAGTTNDDGLSGSPVTACCSPTADGQISGGGILILNRAVRLPQVTDRISCALCVGEQSDFAVDKFGRQRNIDSGYPSGWMVGTVGVGTPANYQNANPALVPPSAWNITTIKYLPNTRTFELPGVKDSPPGPNNPLMSPHSGGVLGLLLDGSAHFISEQMDPLTLRRLAARNDGSPAAL